jgi:hypothetical protein
LYKCREDKDEIFIYTKKPNIKSSSKDKGATKTMNFSGRNELGNTPSGEQIVMNWLDRKYPNKKKIKKSLK